MPKTPKCLGKPVKKIASIAFVAFVACGPMPEAKEPDGTTVTVSEGSYGDEPQAKAKPAPPPEPGAISEALPLDPTAKPLVDVGKPLVGGSASEGPLPVPTTLAATKGALFVFGRTRAGYVVRIHSNKWTDKNVALTPPVIVASAFDDDAEPVAKGDGDGAWFGVSSKGGGSTRIVRVSTDGSGAAKIVNVAPRDDGTQGAPNKLGRIAVFVPLKGHVAVIGRDGNAITFARLLRNGTFIDPSAKVIAQTSAESEKSRSPRGVNEDDKVLLAWDGNDLSGALEAPGTTPEERAASKPGIYVQRFDGNGQPASPLRRLTRPGFEAHALDVAVELGACAVLSRTDDGYEMFRFVRKGNDLGPYGGGLHLAGPTTQDVSLSTDVVGTLAVTSGKLLRIGPGVKIVPSPLGFTPPSAQGSSAAFDTVRLSSDGSGAYALLGTTTSFGVLPTIAKIDGEKMGAVLPTPWIGPPPQRLVLASYAQGEGLALVVDAGKLNAVRLGADGTPKSTSELPFESSALDALEWSRAPVPRVARAGGEWLVSMRDGRVLVVTGSSAGKLVTVGAPNGAVAGGLVAIASESGKPGLARLFFIPPPERLAEIATATIDPIAAKVVDPWATIAGSEHHFGVLGSARYVALARNGGGLYLIANSGPKVTSVAQLYDLVVLGVDGAVVSSGVAAPSSVQEIALAPSTAGPTLIASLTGHANAVRWLESSTPSAPSTSWKESYLFTAFRQRGDGPIVRDKGKAWVLPSGALPFELTGDVASLAGERCPFVLAVDARKLLFVCEEGSGATPLAARAVAHAVSF